MKTAPITGAPESRLRAETIDALFPCKGHLEIHDIILEPAAALCLYFCESEQGQMSSQAVMGPCAHDPLVSVKIRNLGQEDLQKGEPCDPLSIILSSSNACSWEELRPGTLWCTGLRREGAPHTCIL